MYHYWKLDEQFRHKVVLFCYPFISLGAVIPPLRGGDHPVGALKSVHQIHKIVRRALFRSVEHKPG